MKRSVSRSVRGAIMGVLMAAAFTGVLAQPTSVPPPTATPMGSPNTQQMATGSPTIEPMQRQLRVNPEQMNVVAYINGATTSALVIPVVPDVGVFIPNPTSPSQYVWVDAFGTFYLQSRQDREGLPAPFTPFAPADRASNDKLVANAAWSPDGKTLAIIIDNPDRMAAEDGVYWWEMGVTGANQIAHNCRPGVNNCIHYVSADGAPSNWYATSLSWSPDGERLLTRAFMDGYGYDGYMMLNRNSDRTHRPAFCPYEYSEWTPDGSGIVVSGRDNNALPTLGVVNPDDCDDFKPAAVWGTAWVTRNGVMRPDGTLVALARVNGFEGAYKLIDGDGNQLSADIGFTTPEDVIWNAGADAVFVRTTDGRSYIASIFGEVSDVTDIVGSTQAYAWVEVQ